MKHVHVILLAAILAVAGLVLPSSQSPASALDVYVTEGTHLHNGRQWRTVCEPYSQTRRCRTEIWATVIRQEGGRFSASNGWAFNNLTYAASPRGLWTTNPLAAYGKVGGAATWTGTDGRTWRTECDTPLTGNGGCRSFIVASVIEASGSGYRWVTKEIFNSMVRFGSTAPPSYPTAPPMTQAPSFLQGRTHFRLGLIVTQANVGTQAKGHARLSNIELDPGGKVGTFRENYWTYSMDMAAGEYDFGQFRATIANLPSGCVTSSRETADRASIGLPPLPPGACDVRAARTFLGAPTVRTGTYHASSGATGNRIQLFFEGSSVTETYLDASDPGRAYSELRLSAHTHPGAINSIGFLFGSTTAPTVGQSLAPLVQQLAEWLPPRSVNPAHVNQALFPSPAGGADKSLWVQSLGSSALPGHPQYFRFRQYVPTQGNPGCIATEPAVRSRIDYGWHSYLCPLGSDGKMAWHHMVSPLVAERHGLCTDASSYACKQAGTQTADYTMPARAGGHVNQALQVIDDDGRLVGMVGLETSLYSLKATSQSQLSLIAVVASR